MMQSSRELAALFISPRRGRGVNMIQSSRASWPGSCSVCFPHRLKARRDREMQEWADEVASEFTERAAKVFDLIDADQSGSLAIDEILSSLREEPEVTAFIVETPNPVLKEFLVPPRVQKAMKEADVDGDGEVSKEEWNGLAAKSLELCGNSTLRTKKMQLDVWIPHRSRGDFGEIKTSGRRGRRLDRRVSGPGGAGLRPHRRRRERDAREGGGGAFAAQIFL